MLILAVTDIPRMTSLFEQFESPDTEIILATDIHRAMDQFDNRNPDLVIFQNHLAGLSADILYKHFASRLKGRTIRFVLISSKPEDGNQDKFEALLDPTANENILATGLSALIAGNQPVFLEKPQQDLDRKSTETCQQDSEATGLYEPPVHQRPSIISDFSLQLSATSNELQHQDADDSSVQDIPKAYHQTPHPALDDIPSPWYRQPVTLLIVLTLAGVIAISLLQHRQKTATHQPVLAQPRPQQLMSTVSNQEESDRRAAGKQQNVTHSKQLLKLPAFIPQDRIDQRYAKEHPGWELYRGQANEYRIFRGKDGRIKAIQVLDRSGAGIQESFYLQMLQELAGSTKVLKTSAATNEGYEIQRGEIAGLQLVQYRDAQGGRLRGIVITWP